MEASNNKVMFIVNDLLKTTKPGKECTNLEFLSFDEDPLTLRAEATFSRYELACEIRTPAHTAKM